MSLHPAHSVNGQLHESKQMPTEGDERCIEGAGEHSKKAINRQSLRCSGLLVKILARDVSRARTPRTASQERTQQQKKRYLPLSLFLSYKTEEYSQQQTQ